jgi:3-methyladenine DNA glycosylase/8-oxoguanine DNA glycosylase
VVELRIRQAGEGIVVDTSEELNPRERQEVKRQLNWMLGLEQDFSAFYTLANQEPKLGRIEEAAQGRLLRCPTLFEDTLKTIMTTNTTWGGTIRMVEALVQEFGDPLPANPTQHAFPTPVRLAAADEETLRKVTRLGYRAPYVLELAQKVASGMLDLESLKTPDIPTIELRKQLLAIKGVGSYAAANLLMLLGRYDFITVDSWALKLVSHEWYKGEPIGKEEVEQAFERWGEWKGLVYWFWEWAYTSEAG